MRLPSALATKTRCAIFEAFIERNKTRTVPDTLIGAARQYKAQNLSRTRFCWDMWRMIPIAMRNHLINTTDGVKVVGGYATNVNDQNIETMLRNALKDELEIVYHE